MRTIGLLCSDARAASKRQLVGVFERWLARRYRVGEHHDWRAPRPMKARMLAACALITAGSVFAQGTVLFGNFNSLGTTHVWGPSVFTGGYMSLVGFGVNDTPRGSIDYAAAGCALIGSRGTGGWYGGATTFAQLLWANGANAPVSSLRPGGQTTTFRTGAVAGLLVPITDTITGLTPDSAAATFDMVAWDNSSGSYPTWTQASVAVLSGIPMAYGMSGPFNVSAIGGSVNTPADMLIPSFNLILTPEPSALALAGLGLAALLVHSRRKSD